jgi:hypothetical protein
MIFSTNRLVVVVVVAAAAAAAAAAVERHAHWCYSLALFRLQVVLFLA